MARKACPSTVAYCCWITFSATVNHLPCVAYKLRKSRLHRSFDFCIRERLSVQVWGGTEQRQRWGGGEIGERDKTTLTNRHRINTARMVKGRGDTFPIKLNLTDPCRTVIIIIIIIYLSTTFKNTIVIV